LWTALREIRRPTDHAAWPTGYPLRGERAALRFAHERAQPYAFDMLAGDGENCSAAGGQPESAERNHQREISQEAEAALRSIKVRPRGEKRPVPNNMLSWGPSAQWSGVQSLVCTGFEEHTLTSSIHAWYERYA
jgi:hypothetical protein